MTTEIIKLNDVVTHHYFTVNPRSFRPNVRDPDGTILVYLDRAAADAEARKRFGTTALVAVVGMGDEKWAMFQREEKYRIVPTN